MKTKVFAFSDQNVSDVIKQTADIIRRGGLVAFPTETVYGLGANALDHEAVKKIFAAKKRPDWDPLIVHVATIEMIKRLVKDLPPIFETLSEKFMPGALTVLLPKSDIVPDAVTAGLSTVAIRMPAHPLARQLIETAGVPIAAPSANLFTQTSPTTAQHVLDDLGGRIDAVIDGGPTSIGVESSVLDLTTNPPRLLRPGGVTKEAIEAVIGQIAVVTKESAIDKRLAPGLSTRHYAPKAEVVLVDPSTEAINKVITKMDNKPIGVLLPSHWPITGRNAVTFDWGNWENNQELAKNLFAGLRYLDKKNVSLIIVPRPNSEDLGLALNNRLEKAAIS